MFCALVVGQGFSILQVNWIMTSIISYFGGFLKYKLHWITFNASESKRSLCKVSDQLVFIL